MIDLVKVSYPDLLKPSLREIGFGLGTIIEFLGLPLLRLKLVNVKAKLRFKQRIDKLMAELDSIPPADRVELPSSIAAPAIEQLSIDREDDRVAWGRRAGEAAGKAGIGLGDAVLEVAWQAVGLLRPTLVRDRG